MRVGNVSGRWVKAHFMERVVSGVYDVTVRGESVKVRLQIMLQADNVYPLNGCTLEGLQIDYVGGRFLNGISEVANNPLRPFLASYLNVCF